MQIVSLDQALKTKVVVSRTFLYGSMVRETIRVHYRFRLPSPNNLVYLLNSVPALTIVPAFVGPFAPLAGSYELRATHADHSTM